MKVALISDIHANLPALNAVLDHARSHQVDAIWNLGDTVGFGAQPELVVRRLREENALSVIGHFDRRVLKFPKSKTKWRKKKRPEAFLALAWAYENLSPPIRDYLNTLPRKIRMGIGETQILLTHGSPLSKKEGLTGKTPDKRLRELASDAEAQLIITGNSHEPFARKLRKDGYFINPGSVGAQLDGDPRASYAILMLTPDMMRIDPPTDPIIEVNHYRLEYDLDKAANEIRKRGLPEAFAQLLIQGRDLDTVLLNPEKWQVPEFEEQFWRVPPLNPDQRKELEDQKMSQVIKLAEKESYNPEHVHQATFLALRLFDELQPLHRLGPEERFWLRCGSLLHDIGKGNKKHHIKALEVILKSKKLPFSNREKNILGSIARYHREDWPKDKHDHFTNLPVVDQRVVTILSSILRVADGLDAVPRGNVIDLKCMYSPEDITVKCQVKEGAKKQKKRALGKGELMEFAFDRELFIEWHRI